MAASESTWEEKFQNEWESYKQEQKKTFFPNILIAGVSGAGKSSLINTIFGEDNAKVSSVRPETQGFHIYYGKDHGRTINLIDSAGYETNQAETYYEDLSKAIREGVDGQPTHIIWYCISIANKRVEDFDISNLEKMMQETQLRERMCVVFTKCDYDDEESTTANTFRKTIMEKLQESNVPLVRNMKFFETYNGTELNLQLGKLLEWSANSLDDADLRRCFVAAQQANLDLKREEALKVIKVAAAGAAAIGAAPVPFADAPLLIAAQVKMVDSILDIYDLSSHAHLSKEAVAQLVVSQAGKALAGRLLKMIPGVGTVAGALITGAVAAMLTTALGLAISEICYRAVDNTLSGIAVEWNNIFDANIVQEMMKKKETI